MSMISLLFSEFNNISAYIELLLTSVQPPDNIVQQSSFPSQSSHFTIAST